MNPNLPDIDYDYLQNVLIKILNAPSPTGFADQALTLVAEHLAEFPDVVVTKTRKGALLAYLKGEEKLSDGAKRALTAHTDTLGGMVRVIKPNGRIELTNIGGFAWNSVEGEGCRVFTKKGVLYGSVLPNHASVHVYSDVKEVKRNADTMEVRIDAVTGSADETRALGVNIGDFVAFDPRVELHNEFVRSRHLDDKASVAVLLASIQALYRADLKPRKTTCFLFSNFEEVGHGGAADIPESVEELVAVDMAAIGEGQNSDEFHATLCVKDSGGPYHLGLSNKLKSLAEKYEIPYKVDIYPNYGSDGTAYWHAGGSAAVALIGPGVDSSHHYERTHKEALLATAKWVLAYLLEE